MPDFTMCSGHNCPLKDTCFRACAKPAAMQSYVAPPFDAKTRSCRIYMPLEGLGAAPARRVAVKQTHADEDAKPR